MRLREHLDGIWLMAMALLSLFAATFYFVSQIRSTTLNAAYTVLVLLQVVALTMYLWGPEKLTFGPLRALYRLLYASSVVVIPVFASILVCLVNQYHAAIPDAIDATSMPVEQILPTDKTVVYNTSTAYVIFPEHTKIALACEERPSESDESITWCSGAAFQHAVEIGFSQENIEGDHAVDGTLYTSPHSHDGFAAFTFANGSYSFEFDDPRRAIREAAEAGGSGFMQYALMRDGQAVMRFDRPRPRCYRALAELNGSVCIIDSVNVLRPNEFLAELRRLGVRNALYMDMGPGWNYSWFRNASNQVVTLFGIQVPWSHNWVIFRK